MKIKQVDLLRDESKMAGALARLFGDHLCSAECAAETRSKWRFGEQDGLFLWHVGLRIMENRTWVGKVLSEDLLKEIAHDSTRMLFAVAEELGVNAQGWGARTLRESDIPFSTFERRHNALGIVTILAVNPRQQLVAFPSDRPAA